MTTVRYTDDRDRGWVVAAAESVLGDAYQAASHRQFRVDETDALLAERDGEPVGFLCWEADGDVCEALAIACTVRSDGVGAALMDALRELAEQRGLAQLRVVTTDGNTRAQRFYERLGYELAERRVGAVDECRRRYKPEIPTDMHDELVYERPVRATIDP